MYSKTLPRHNAWYACPSLREGQKHLQGQNLESAALPSKALTRCILRTRRVVWIIPLIVRYHVLQIEAGRLRRDVWETQPTLNVATFSSRTHFPQPSSVSIYNSSLPKHAEQPLTVDRKNNTWR